MTGLAFVVATWFRSTLPRGERQLIHHACKATVEFRSTLPRGERPREGLLRARLRPVSIHAPARGATCCGVLVALIWSVSIHAPARGATRAHFDNRRPPAFRSTLPRGERPSTKDTKRKTLFVSIHAPARGATCAPAVGFLSAHVSIHAPARGATQRIVTSAGSL